jgi:hypothetical protein
VEIPITFSNDTPLSGENIPVDASIDATELQTRPPSGPASDAAEFEEYPTQVQVSPFDEVHPEEAQTTQKRGPEFAQQLAHARRVSAGASGSPPTRPASQVAPPSSSARDTEPTGKPIALRSRRPPPEPPRDDQDTVIKPNAGFPLPRRKVRKPPSSPDDTIKLDEVEVVEDRSRADGDPTQLMASRLPKTPR